MVLLLWESPTENPDAEDTVPVLVEDEKPVQMNEK